MHGRSRAVSNCHWNYDKVSAFWRNPILQSHCTSCLTTSHAPSMCHISDLMLLRGITCCSVNTSHVFYHVTIIRSLPTPVTLSHSANRVSLWLAFNARQRLKVMLCHHVLSRYVSSIVPMSHLIASLSPHGYICHPMPLHQHMYVTSVRSPIPQPATFAHIVYQHRVNCWTKTWL